MVEALSNLWHDLDMNGEIYGSDQKRMTVIQAALAKAGVSESVGTP